MTRKFIIISALLVFIVSPLVAWNVVRVQYTTDPQSKLPDKHVTPATKGELLEAVMVKHKEEHIDQDNVESMRIIAIESYEHLNTWWYIVKVKYASFGKENPIALPMLVVKYHNGPDEIKIITNPGELLPFYNMSDSSGIPYEVIDKYNKAISESQPDIDIEEE